MPGPNRPVLLGPPTGGVRTPLAYTDYGLDRATDRGNVFPRMAGEDEGTTTPDLWPTGVSHMQIATESGWPDTELGIVTHRTSLDGDRVLQYAWEHNDGPIYFRTNSATSDSWDNWYLWTPTSYDSAFIDYTATADNTWETIGTLTISDFPTSKFSCAVMAWGSVYVANATADADHVARVSISLDGGSTWTDGPFQRADTELSSNVQSLGLSPLYRLGGDPTGSIQVRLQGQTSNAANSGFNEPYVMALVVAGDSGDVQL